MSKGKFLLGALLGGSAAVYATLKLTGTTKDELIQGTQEKVKRFREENDLEGDDWESELKDRIFDSAADLKDKVLESKDDLFESASDSFQASTDQLRDEMDQENDIFVKGEDAYEAPTEVFMPHSKKEA
ncbi:Hypothetical protein ADU72_1825 [Pediococcus damnosus]|uniref:Gas vesicle protein n=1 Tax=Pediococcus damnosus TaxID=51663 RepID=A0A0R2GU74_9LACO|nr:hypothetical protein [Pediococcus damnosus]AMV59906.1 Hypothetical protein ADU69_0228 [Pediococcus damnosus]AMV62390.1 Hypothetical protein ADU70_0896 [Pediococcus damnosus]AMV64151.1 Hypothetical protein ADU71_0228 [Pediococcus damnosus]AMV67750.1 Hypothetical protein ADU72_1825 [Pediococcus damnosus]AMV69975.1 Hypothetical protein ADU73_1583 [Pediococcus damnosus]